MCTTAGAPPAGNITLNDGRGMSSVSGTAGSASVCVALLPVDEFVDELGNGTESAWVKTFAMRPSEGIVITDEPFGLATLVSIGFEVTVLE